MHAWQSKAICRVTILFNFFQKYVSILNFMNLPLIQKTISNIFAMVIHPLQYEFNHIFPQQQDIW